MENMFLWKGLDEKRKKEIGERIAKARGGFSQYGVSRCLGVSESTVRNWEKGRTQCTQYKHLKWFADHGGVTIDYLTGAVDDPCQSAVEAAAMRMRKKSMLSLEFINSLSGYHFERRGVDQFEVLERDDAAPGIEPAWRKIDDRLTVIAGQTDMRYLARTISACADAIVNSYVESELIGRAIDKKTGGGELPPFFQDEDNRKNLDDILKI